LSIVYEIRILDPAARELARMDAQAGRRIVKRIRWLAENLDSTSPEALKGALAGLYKLRAGDYRIIYQILYDQRTIVVHLIGHRSQVYR